MNLLKEVSDSRSVTGKWNSINPYLGEGIICPPPPSAPVDFPLVTVNGKTCNPGNSQNSLTFY